MIREDAPAKINLYLHVGPVREDGLHDLASLFVFTEKGDVISAAPADDLSLEITGSFAPVLHGHPLTENLVYKAAEMLREKSGVSAGARLTLEKKLPVAAGIGGGSADAAAALRALVGLWDLSISDAELEALAFGLGADIPACLAGTPILVEGAGEVLRPAPALPPLYVCLVNPGIDMPTGPVFRQFDAGKTISQIPVHPELSFQSANDIADLMKHSRNDLEDPAMEIDKMAIANVLEILRGTKGVLGARMSGSGATCFALFADEEDAQAARQQFSKMPYWTMVSRIASG